MLPALRTINMSPTCVWVNLNICIITMQHHVVSVTNTIYINTLNMFQELQRLNLSINKLIILLCGTIYKQALHNEHIINLSFENADKLIFTQIFMCNYSLGNFGRENIKLAYSS